MLNGSFFRREIPYSWSDTVSRVGNVFYPGQPIVPCGEDSGIQVVNPKSCSAVPHDMPEVFAGSRQSEHLHRRLLRPPQLFYGPLLALYLSLGIGRRGTWRWWRRTGSADPLSIG